VNDNVYVIPNALVPEQFTPAAEPPDTDGMSKGSLFYSRVHLILLSSVTIVVISRLAYRKGIDLLVAVAPTICEKFPNVRFLVGGDGPKLIDLLQMREKYLLEDRIILLGPIKPRDVRSVSQDAL
jgi:phosphatidylinositol glycan class A protein